MFSPMKKNPSIYKTPFIQFTGIQSAGKTVSMLIRASIENLLAEAERSIPDALCVLRCLVKKRALLAGGGAGNFRVFLRFQKIVVLK